MHYIIAHICKDWAGRGGGRMKGVVKERETTQTEMVGGGGEKGGGKLKERYTAQTEMAGGGGVHKGTSRKGRE
jgi:hypothetical protein